MTGIPTFDIVLYFLGLLGMGGIVSGIVVKSVNRRIDRSDKRRDELEQARLESNLQVCEGVMAIGELAAANCVAIRDGKTNGETKHALEEYEIWKKKRESFVERQAAEHLRGEA